MTFRFVNHSSNGFQNSYARGKYVRGINRIGLFALRKINRGEELFFDYLMKENVPWLAKYNRYYSVMKTSI
jgi:SET domain-containing protein